MLAKGIWYLIVAAAILFVAAGIHASEALKAVVGSYLEIHALLAADKIAGVKAPAAALASKAEAMGEGGAAMAKAAKAVGEAADLSAVWVRFPELSVQRLPQRYTRLAERRYRYESNGGAFMAELEVDDLGLVIAYEGIWQRIAVASSP